MKKIIIAGSEGLIGTELSNFLGNKGHNIVRCDLALGHDLNDETFTRSFFEKNKADCLINTFALNDHVESSRKMSGLFDISLESLGDYLNVNLTCLFSVCREFARNNESGSIVNFSSTYGVVSPYPELYDKGKEKHIGYCISKAGVLQLTRYLAAHLAPNFRVNCVIPGGIKHEQNEEFVRKYSDKTPMGRMMNITELNGIVEYLCSNAASYTSGALMNIDGGWTSW